MSTGQLVYNVICWATIIAPIVATVYILYRELRNWLRSRKRKRESDALGARHLAAARQMRAHEWPEEPGPFLRGVANHARPRIMEEPEPYDDEIDGMPLGNRQPSRYVWSDGAGPIVAPSSAALRSSHRTEFLRQATSKPKPEEKEVVEMPKYRAIR